MGQLVEYHPKMMRRVANNYVDVYLQQGHDAAQKWADNFMTAEYKKKLAPIITEVVQERGLKPK